MSDLDQAALRRFDLKVKFDYLKPKQSCELLIRQSQQLRLDAPTNAQLSRLSRMNSLTPGDFAAVTRQSRFRAINSLDELVTALEADCGVKECARLIAGFLK